MAIIVNKSPKCNTCLQSQKQQNNLCLFPSKPFSITVIQVYVLTSNAEEAEAEHFYEDLQVLLELKPQKRFPFHYRGLECKSRKSKIPGVTVGKFGLGVQNEAGQRLTEFCKRMHWS